MSAPIGEPSMPPRQQRPFGVGLLAMLHVLLGLVGAILLAFPYGLLWWNEALRQTGAFEDPPSAFLVAYGSLVFALLFVGGVGLWRGAPLWGWSVVVFLFLSSIIQFVLELLPLFGTESLWMEDLAWELLSVAALVYLFRPSVVRFFWKEHSVLRPVLVQIAVAALFFAILSAAFPEIG